MNPEDKGKLENILARRKESMSSIINFEDLFIRFSRFTLRQSVDEINLMLQNQTNDVIKILFDDPFEFTKGPYFVQLKLYINIKDNFLNNYSIGYRNSEPTLRFVGQPSEGKVEVSQRLINESNYLLVTNIKVADLTPDYVSNFIVDFIEKSYNKD